MAGGRLIFPRMIEIAHLDTTLTEYDDELREPALERAGPDDRIGRRSRRERVVRCAAQVNEANIEAMDMMLNGLGPQNEAIVTFHFNDLDDEGLVDDDGEPLISINDRLLCIMTMDTERVIYRPRDPPGLYIVEARPASFSFGSDAEWNLLECKLMDREVGSDR